MVARLAGRAGPEDASERVLGVYKQSLESHVIPEVGTLTLAELRRRDCIELVGTLYKKGLAKNTIKRTIAALKKALDAAVDAELLAPNPATRLELPDKAPLRKAKPPTPKELRKVLDKATPDARDIIVTISGLGLRRGEALALRWLDVDFERNLLFVRRQNIRGRIEEKTKTDAGTRTVPLFANVRAALEARAKRLELPPVRWLANDRRLIFANSLGGPLEPTNWSRREWKPALTAAGIEDLHVHDLRHSAASQLHRLGMDNKLRSVVIGHADERVTDEIYTTVDEETLQAIASKIDPLATALGSAQ